MTVMEEIWKICIFFGNSLYCKNKKEEAALRVDKILVIKEKNHYINKEFKMK
jgi:hypothetical protein